MTITYDKGKITVSLLAEPIKAAIATSKYMADYLRKKLLGKSAGPTQERLIREMSDAELVEAYASYQEQKYAEVTIVK